MFKKNARHQFLALLLIPLGFALYSAALRAPFVYDDRGYIVTNADIRSLSNFLDFSGTRYVGFLSFALNYRIGGLTPFDFHLTNILVHIINAMLVFFIVMEIYKTPLVRSMCRETGARTAFVSVAFASSVIFLAHPVETQAVAYVTQRFASLATLFYALAVFLYSRARALCDAEARGLDNHRGAGMKKWSFYAASLISTVVAMKTKEISFTIPFVITLYDYVFFPEGFRKEGMPLRIPFYLTLLIIPLSLLGPEIGIGSVRGIAGDLRKMELHDAGSISGYAYMLTQLSVIVTYIRLLLFPANQRIDYDYPLSGSLFEARALSSLFIILSLISLAVYVLWRSKKEMNFYGPLFSFGIFWFFITLLVESSVVPIQDVIFEQRAYLPSMGFIIAAVAAAAFLAGRICKRAGLRIAEGMPALFILAAVCPLLFYAVHKRNLIWTDEMLLLNDAIGKSPRKARLYYARALVHMDRREFAEAVKDSTEAITLNPKLHNQYNIRGIAYSSLKMYRESLKDLTTAIAYDPTVAASYYNRGITYTSLGEYGKAVSDYNSALAIDPGYADAYNNRGVVYSLMGEFKKAEADLKSACAKGHGEGCRNLMRLKGG